MPSCTLNGSRTSPGYGKTGRMAGTGQGGRFSLSGRHSGYKVGPHLCTMFLPLLERLWIWVAMNLIFDPHSTTKPSEPSRRTRMKGVPSVPTPNPTFLDGWSHASQISLPLSNILHLYLLRAPKKCRSPKDFKAELDRRSKEVALGL